MHRLSCAWHVEFSGPKIKHVSFALQGGFLSPELPGDPVMRSFKIYCVSVQLLSCVQLFATPCTTAHQTSLSITNSKSLIKLMSIQSVMPSNHLILCHPLLFLPSIFPIIRVFSNESVLRIRWPKYWSFNYSISPSNEYSGLIYFRIDWFDLLAAKGPSRVFSSTTA